MKRSRLAIALGSLFTVFLIGTLGLSLAWFTTVRFVPEFENLSGSVLTSYFDRNDNPTGDFGSETNPFVITTPKHWENLAKLHYAMPGFSGNDSNNPKEYYFQIGKDFNGDGSFLVYNYNDEGVKQDNPAYSAILNLGGLQVLPPLGSDTNPFSNHITGNSITIKNFTIGGEGYGDMGIFGYVGERGTCQNLYFSDFTIDASATSPISDPLHAEHASGQENHGYFGFLAGHLYDSKSFTNVYVNRCRITGTRTDSSSDATNRYGYYGHVNLDSLGGQSGIGSNYEFSLDANATHQYFNGAYDSLRDKDLYVRRTESADKSTHADRKPILNDGYSYEKDAGNKYTFTNTTTGESAEEAEAVRYWAAPVISGDGDTKLKFSEAVRPKYDNTLGVNTYYLNGDSPKSSGNAYNYSLSTIGTIGKPTAFQTRYFDIRYKDGDEYKTIESLKRLVPKDDGKGGTELVEDGSVEVREETSQEELANNLKGLLAPADPNVPNSPKYHEGKYLYYDAALECWQYVTMLMGYAGETVTIKGENHEDKTVDLIVNLAESVEGSAEYSNGAAKSIKVDNFSIQLNLDGNAVEQFDLPSSVTKDTIATITHDGSTIKVKSNLIKGLKIRGLLPGTHTIRGELKLQATLTGNRWWIIGNWTCYLSVTIGFGGAISNDGKTVISSLTTFSNFSSHTETLSQNLISLATSEQAKYPAYPSINYSDPNISNSELLTAKGPTSAYPVYGRRMEILNDELNQYKYTTANEEYSPLKAKNSVFEYGSYDVATINIDFTVNEPITKEMWFVEANDLFEIDGQEDIRFVADPAYNDPGDGSEPTDTNPITTSGYRANNMDLVGGDVGFFSYSIFNSTINVISMPGQQSNPSSNPIKLPKTNEKFYSTKQTPSSIVLYLKNTSNAIDDANDSLGKIAFTYVKISLLGFNLFTTQPPVFLKGSTNNSANTINLTDNRFGGVSTSSTLTTTVTIEELKEYQTMAASYCALDKYGKIIGRFGNDLQNGGRPTFTPLVPGLSEEEALSQIDTYVLVLGCNASNADNDRGTWITKIDFSYKAEDGYGGTFGSVEYRDANDTATNTVFNFYLTYPAGTQATFDVQVEYVPTDETRPSTGGTYTLTISTNVQITLRYFLYYSGFTVNIVSGNNTVSNATSPGIYSTTISPP